MTRRRLRPLIGLAMVALIIVGCGSSAPSETGTANSTATARSGTKTLSARDKAVKFSECVRAHGVSDFPDPNAKNEFEYGVSVTPDVWTKAVNACKALQPPGTLSSKRDAKQKSAALRFADCIRRNGVKDFPDPVDGEPLVNTYKIPSSNRPGGMTILNAAMHKCGDEADDAVGGREVSRKAPAAAAVLVAAIVTGGVVAMSSAEQATPSAQDAPANTAQVQQGELSAMVSEGGTLTYRARSDGSPYSAINQASGVYTKLPESGDRVDCGGVLYRVDDKPVVLLCGTVPAYRALHTGQAGRDARQLRRNLRALGYHTIKAFQRKKGLAATGTLDLGDVVFLPEPVRIAKVTGDLGGPARPGAPVLSATSDKLHVQVALDPSQQGAVKKGDLAQITLPGNTPVAGRVEGFGRVAQAPTGQDSKPDDATIPTYIRLDDVRKARGLDRAPVGVQITTEGVENALSVPVTALVGKSGGGFAVEVVRAGGRRELVAVQLGLFDTAGGRVQVEGAVREGEQVVVPSL